MVKNKINPPTKTTAITEQRATTGGNELLDVTRIMTEHLEIKPGEIVADLGAGGAAYFTIQAARMVGENGQVYAVDVVKNVLSGIDSKAQMSGFYNIKTIWSNLEIVGATKIPAASVDHAILANILFQSQKRHEILNETIRLLKPGGDLLIIDWSNAGIGFAPAENIMVNQQDLIAHAEKMSLTLKQQFQAGQYHFGLVFVK